MKALRHILLLTICFSFCLFTVERTAAQIKKEDFLIDPSKPYVYLEMDHVGPRKPLRDGEPNMGIWLGLKNNSRLPVVVIASKASDDRTDQPLWVGDEVVPNRPSTGTESPGAGIGYQPGQGDLTDIFLWPNTTEAEVIGAEDAVKSPPRISNKSGSVKRPHGYNNGYQPGPQVLRVVPPGGEVLFSVPVNHVSKTWHFEIPFRLALPNGSRIRPPYSHVAFYEEDLNHGNTAQPTPTTR